MLFSLVFFLSQPPPMVSSFYPGGMLFSPFWFGAGPGPIRGTPGIMLLFWCGPLLMSSLMSVLYLLEWNIYLSMTRCLWRMPEGLMRMILILWPHVMEFLATTLLLMCECSCHEFYERPHIGYIGLLCCLVKWFLNGSHTTF
jgi:hypothetical protein